MHGARAWRTPRWSASYHQGGTIAYEIEMVGERDMLKSLGAPKTDGVWVCEVQTVTDGTNDWDGRPEYALDGTWRPVKPEEWNAYVNDEYVWDEPKAEQTAEESSK